MAGSKRKSSCMPMKIKHKVVIFTPIYAARRYVKNVMVAMISVSRSRDVSPSMDALEL